MPSIRVHKPNGALFFDFRYREERCREYTLLPDTPSNRKKLERVLDKLESEISAGTFVYANYFPSSKALKRFERHAAAAEGTETPIAQVVQALGSSVESIDLGPQFSVFATQWVDEHSIEWRRSHIRSLLSTLNGRLVPHFGD